ncbi:peptidylprolyl isomerase [Catenovulum agarivorans]|uniref:peptidylprolyl isomerase n=1 Tax=Catenovulum agarivorans TaxID=1172192 RepID=UPI0002F89069|nr:peptidylprolyl isomerase [Catenovulum agarivorans]
MRKLSVIALIAWASLWQGAHATVVLVETNLGDFEINLYDDTTPKTVENFLSYVNSGAYEQTAIHRLVKGFVMQTGGYYLGEDNLLAAVETDPAVENEPVYSNVRGTIAMAKLGGDANSATSQWFINLADNSGNLDAQNGGFTVFGQVTGTGMEIIDAIAAQPNYYLNSTFAQTPVKDYTEADEAAETPITVDNLIYIEQITIVNTETNTAIKLTRPLTTYEQTEQPTDGNSASGSSGGAFSYAWLLFAAAISLFRRK